MGLTSHVSCVGTTHVTLSRLTHVSCVGTTHVTLSCLTHVSCVGTTHETLSCLMSHESHNSVVMRCVTHRINSVVTEMRCDNSESHNSVVS